METSAIPTNETERISALRVFKILDTATEQDFDDIVELASQLCDTPFSLITLIDEERQWFKARHGIDLIQTHRDISFCAHTIHETDLMIVKDTVDDIRFSDNPFVAGEPKIRFYAGMPLITEEGYAVGTLCVLDQKPRSLTSNQQTSLRVLAKQVLNLLKLRLKISEDASKLSAYFNSTKDIICLIGSNYNIVAFNKVAQDAVKRIFGRQISIGDNILDYIQDSFIEKFKTHFSKAYSGRKLQFAVFVPFPVEMSWLSTTYLPVFNHAGEIIAIAFTVTDFTSQKKAEHKLKINIAKKQFIAKLGNAVGRAEKVDQIYQIALDALRKKINADKASVLLLDNNGVMRFAAAVGLSDDYMIAVKGHSPWQEDEKNISAIFVPDVLKSRLLKNLLPAIQKESIKAIGFIPLIYQNRLNGKLMVYYNDVHEFNREEIQFAESIARHVAYAIGQKKSENELIESEEKYRSVVNSIREIIFKTDVHGRFIFLNPAWTETTGFSIEESIGRSLIDFVHPDDHEVTNSNYEALLNFQKDYYRHELRLITKNGQTRWFEISKRLILGSQNNVVGTTGTFNDITQHKSAEIKLAENQRFLQTLINNLPGYVYRVKNNPAYTPEYLSEGVVKITGHTPEEYLVERTISGDHSTLPEDKERIWNKVQEAIAKKLPYEFTYRIAHVSGKIKWVWERGQGIWNNDGELIAIEGFITDINDKKMAEDALQKSKDNLRTVFENAEVGYILLNYQLLIISFNKPADAFTFKEHYKQLKIGSNLADYFSDEALKTLSPVWASVLAGQAIEYDRKMPSQNEDGSWYRIKYSPISNKENVTNGMVMSMEDITERKKADIELKKSFDLVTAQNKRLVNFSYIVSHNLRSHATNIKAILGIMEETVSEKDRQEMMDHLKTVSNSLDETLYNLNEVVSIQNTVNLISEPLNLNKYINKAINVLSEQIFLRSVMIKNEIPKDVMVNYNPAYLESIILNFLSNAVKYSHPEKQPIIILSIFYHNNKPVFSIQDNGIGIDLKKNGDKLFGMYKTFNGNPDARGIGLFISKSQIDFMGGKVEVESELNEGTTFKIYF